MAQEHAECESAVCQKSAIIAVLQERSETSGEQLNRIEDNVSKIFSRLDTMTWSALSALALTALALAGYILKLKGW